MLGDGVKGLVTPSVHICISDAEGCDADATGPGQGSGQHAIGGSSPAWPMYTVGRGWGPPSRPSHVRGAGEPDLRRQGVKGGGGQRRKPGGVGNAARSGQWGHRVTAENSKRSIGLGNLPCTAAPCKVMPHSEGWGSCLPLKGPLGDRQAGRVSEGSEGPRSGWPVVRDISPLTPELDENHMQRQRHMRGQSPHDLLQTRARPPSKARSSTGLECRPGTVPVVPVLRGLPASPALSATDAVGDLEYRGVMRICVPRQEGEGERGRPSSPVAQQGGPKAQRGREGHHHASTNVSPTCSDATAL
eukprot:EG_transcript_9769